MRQEPYVYLTRTVAAGVRSLVPIADTLDSSLGGLLVEAAIGDIRHEALIRGSSQSQKSNPSLSRGGHGLIL
jgi:hypothetical protein